jgi:GNAT superfamily N-acetyltransferase
MRVVRDAGIGGDIALVARLLVDPPARRQGFGALLLDHARSEAVAQGRSPVLDVVASATSAITLYRSRGWKEIGRTTFAMPDIQPIEEIVFAGPH